MRQIIAVAVLVAVCGLSANASVTRGSIGFATPLLAEANASPTGDINTSTVFTLESLATTDNASGVFAGLPVQSFGVVVFDTTVPTSLHITDGEFGKFVSSSISVVTNTPGFLNLFLKGTWTPGTFMGSSGGPSPADFRISFTQSPTALGEISFSGTMSTALAVVPEPPSAVLFLTGAGLIVVGAKLRSAFRA